MFGYDRFDRIGAIDLMNDLYRNEWNLYQNQFIPTMKLLVKEKINSKYKRRYESPKTPYKRLLESNYITKQEKKRLKETHLELNPFKLKMEIERKLKIVFQFVTPNIKPRTKI